MTPPARSLSPFWAHAAAFGAIWGAVEITLGSFLHTLHLPLTGTTLSAIGAALLVAQRQLVPTRGLTLATGLVAASCKMLSPGGAIIGPMVGIAVEALLVELALLAAPRSWPSALLAGLLAVAWATGQKLLTQVALYGGDVLDLYVATLRRVATGLGLDPSAGWAAVAAVAGLIALLGLVAGAAGYRVGRLAAHVRCGAPGTP